MKRLGTYAIVALVAMGLGFFLSSKIKDDREPEVVIKRDTVTVTVVDSIPFKLTDTVRIKSEPVVITIPKIIHDTTVIKTVVETKRYAGIDTLTNGVIDWEIYADSLYARSFKLTTEKEYITETITKILPPKSRLYLSTGIDANFKTKKPQAAEIGIMYNRRQRWGAGLIVRQDFTKQIGSDYNTTLGIRVQIGI